MKYLLLLALFFSVTQFAQAEDDAAIVSSRARFFTGKLPASHPRLLLSKADLPQLRTFVTAWRQSREGAALWKKIALEPGERSIPPEPLALPGKKGVDNAEVAHLWRQGYETANDAGNTAWRFSFLYLITGEEKYGREAARWLMALANWRADKTAFRNNDEQFIQATRPMIFAYDWAYDALTPEERTTLETNLISRLALLHEDQRKLFSLTHPTAPSSNLSHPMRFISTLGQGGLALFYEKEQAPEYLAWAYEYYLRQFPVWGGEDGGWAEGLEYWASGNSQHLRFLDGMAQLGFDEPLKRGFFRNNAYFGLYNLMPYPASSFGDLTNITKPDPNRFLLIEKYGILNHDRYPLAFAQLIGNHYPSDMGYYGFNAIDSLLHVWRKGQQGQGVANLADLPQSRYFADIGWVSMHSRLGDKNNDIMLTLKSSPFGSASHSHNDQNAFVINAFGEPLAISSGYRDWYDSAHHLGWTRTTQSKNAILFGGVGQPSKDPDAKGAILHYLSGRDFTFATGDATAAYRQVADRALRHVFFVKRRYFVMLDELQAKEASSFEWLLHGREKMRLDPEQGEILERKGQSQLRVSFLLPPVRELKFSQTDAFTVPVDPAFAKGLPNEWHVTVQTQQPKTQEAFFTLLYPATQDEALPATQLVAVKKGFAARILFADERDLIWMAKDSERQVDSSEGHLNGLAASFIEQQGALTAVTVIETQFLKFRGWDLKSAFPVSLAASKEKTGWRLEIQAKHDAVLKMPLAEAPRQILGIGKNAWKYQPQNRELTLKISDNERLIEILK